MPIGNFGWQDSPSVATPLDATNLEAFGQFIGTYTDSKTSAIASTTLVPSGGDDSAAMVTALATGGLILMGPGTFLWNTSVPAFARNTPTRVVGAGIGKTIIKLSGGAPRAFDFNKIADGDTFKSISITDLTVDCNSVGGLHHVVIGNFQNGALQTRFNVAGLRVERVATINVPSATTTSNYNTATLHRLNIHVAIVDNANQGTQYSLTDCQVNDCAFGASGGGGNEGVFLGGTVAAAVTGLNVWVDNCHINASTWTSGAVPTQFFASAGFQIGSCAFGGRCTINRCLATYAGDVGYENDSMMRVDHVECEAVDCWNFGFYVRNVQYVAELQAAPPTSGQAQTQAQQHTYMQCIARRLTVTNMRGFRVDTFNSIPLGHFVFRDCVWDRETTDFVATTGEAFFTIGTVASILIDGFKVSLPALSATGVAAVVSLITADGAGPETFKVQNTQVYLGGANTSGNVQTINIVSALSQTVSPQTTHVHVDGLFIDPGGGTGFTSGNFALNGVQLGQSSANTTNITAVVRRAKFNAPAAFASSWTGVVIGASSHTTINSRTGIRITECDFSAVNGNPVTIGAGNLANVYIDRCGPSRTGTATSYTALQTDDLVSVTDTSAARTITLPPTSAMPAGKVLTVMDESNAAGTNGITISRAGSDTFLGGGTTRLINQNGGTFKVYSSGSTWVSVPEDSSNLARDYGILGDAVVDINGQLISGTDDTAGWLRLIAALPTDKAVVRLHGMSLVSAQLGFNTSDLAMIGDGPQTGFVLAHNTNTNVLRFNTSGTNTGPPRLQRVYIENFMVDHQGYYQADPGGGIAGALVAYACTNFTAKAISVRNAKSTSMSVIACRQVEIHEPFIDTVVPGGAANGINCVASPTAFSTFIRLHDGHFIDVPDKAIDAGGVGADSITLSGNTVELRNLRPATAGIFGNPFIGFQPGGTTAAAWSNLTNYAVGNFVSNGGFNYVALVASGPGNGGAITPGTNNLIWWLQNPPLAWSSGTSYVVGQCVYYTAPTGVTGQVEGGTTLNLTCISASTNNQPVNGSGNIDSHWQIGGPITSSGRSAGTIGAETTPSPSTRDVSLTGNTLWGQNLAGEYVIGNGIQVSSSKSFPGISAVNVTIAGNTIRGCGLAIIANDEVTNVTGNTIDDCTSGIQLGMNLSFSQRNLLIASNTIRLGGIGGGAAIVVTKPVANFALSQAHVSDNIIDGAMGPTMYLSSAVTGGPLTTVNVAHVTTALPTGQVVLLGKLPQGGSGIIQAVTLTAPAAVGDVLLTVASFTAATTFNTAGGVTPLVGTITGTLASAVAITSIPITALVAAYQLGTTVTIPNSTGATPLNATLSVAAKVGDTALTVTSVTPSTTYASGLPVGVWGTSGISIQGGVTQSSLSDNIVNYTSLWAYPITTNNGTPSTLDLVDCWSYNCGGHITIGSTIPGVRVLGGGFVAAASGGGSFTGTGANYVLRRGVSGINPGGVVTGPAVPSTTVNATNQTGFDCTVYVTGGTVTDIKVGGTTLGGPTSGPVRVVAGQTIALTYSVLPTWVWVAD